MSRPFSRLRIAGALSLLAGLTLLPGCTSKSSDDDGVGTVSRIVYAVRQHTTIDADGTVVAGNRAEVAADAGAKVGNR